MEYIAQLAASPEAWVALATLIVMEVVLGIDNLIFISILTNRLPEEDRPQLVLKQLKASIGAREKIGVVRGPVFPQGNDVAQGDLSLVDPVIENAERFRYRST